MHGSVTENFESFLIVNADDFGYMPGISLGIIEAADRGIVTATGVFANAPDLEDQVDPLRRRDHLDTGVHLNLTSGLPVSGPMRALVRRWHGRFPRKLTLLRALATGSMGLESVAQEWRAQIDRCRSSGLTVRVLNSHEHVHMLPPLFALARRLAGEYGIPHVRFTSGEWFVRRGASAAARGLIIGAMGLLAPATARAVAPRMLGLAASGRIDLPHLANALDRLRRGGIYELMCHPGRTPTGEAVDPELARYHDWDGERLVLCSGEARRLCADNGIRLIGYRDLDVVDGRLVVRPPRIRR